MITENPKIFSFQLLYHILFNTQTWIESDPSKDYNMDFNTPSSLHKYFQYIKSPSDFGKYLGFSYGFDKLFSKVVLGDVVTPLFMKYKDPQYMARTLCDMMYYEKEGNPDL